MGNYNESYKKYYKSIQKNNLAGGKYPGGKTDEDISYNYSRQNDIRRFRSYNRVNYISVFMKQSMVVIMLLVVFSGAQYLKEPTAESIRGNYDKYITEWDMAQGLKGMNLEDVQEAVIMKIDEALSKVSRKESIFVTMKEDFLYPFEGKIETEKVGEKGLLLKNRLVGVVRSSYTGEIKSVESSGGKYTVILDHGKGVETKYEGLSNVYWNEGDQLESGEALGFAGISKEDGFNMVFRIFYMGEEKDVLKYIGAEEV